jgi:hypothetical protein
LRDFVDRLFNLDTELKNAKTEHGDLVRDLKAEVKAREDETGVNFKEVQRLAKIKLDESTERERMELLCGDFETFDVIFGPPSVRSSDATDDEAGDEDI